MLAKEKKLTFVRNQFRLEQFEQFDQIFQQIRMRHTGESPADAVWGR